MRAPAQVHKMRSLQSLCFNGVDTEDYLALIISGGLSKEYGAQLLSIVNQLNMLFVLLDLEDFTKEQADRYLQRLMALLKELPFKKALAKMSRLSGPSLYMSSVHRTNHTGAGAAAGAGGAEVDADRKLRQQLLGKVKHADQVMCERISSTQSILKVLVGNPVELRKSTNRIVRALRPLSQALLDEMFSGFVQTAACLDFDNRGQVRRFSDLVDQYLALAGMLQNSDPVKVEDIEKQVTQLRKTIGECRLLLAMVREYGYRDIATVLSEPRPSSP